MDMSLDEIIQKKKIGGNTQKKRKTMRPATGVPATRAPIMDARNKIIQKNRLKIRDAREKLAQITKASGDARLRLMRKRNELSPKRLSIGSGLIGSGAFRQRKLLSPLKQPKIRYAPVKLQPQHLVGVPRGYIDYDNMEMEEAAEYQPDYTALRMTVRNNMMPPPLPPSRSERMMPPMRVNTDPFDCYEIPKHRAAAEPKEPINIRRQIRNMSPDCVAPKGILRSKRQSSPPPPFSSRRYLNEQPSHLSYEMRSRLEHAPDQHASMGIFANPLTKQSSSSSSSSTSGCRIVVSNLHNSVTQSDIKELFEDIGELHEARLVRPGIAEVIFKTLKDAEKAVETYHNRQLDGQPMKCLLVNPRASNKPTAPAIKSSNSFSTRSSNKTPLEIDIDALHKVLFRRH